jgi:hypothetical protein
MKTKAIIHWRHRALLLLPAATALTVAPLALSETTLFAADQDSQVSSGTSSVLSDTFSAAMTHAQDAVAQAANVGRSVAYAFAGDVSPRTLVLAGDKLKPAEADELSEDLAVMSRILQKSTRDDENGKQVWIDLNGLRAFGRGVDALYLEDYGPLFLMSVDFPLVRPPEEEPAKEAEVSDETWDQTRRELSGDALLGREYRVDVVVKAAPYKSSRVEQLQDDLVDALKHAVNIRGLAEDDTICVAVFGPRAPAEGGRTLFQGRHLQGRAESRILRAPYFGQGKDARTSVLTLRARQSDVAAFAKKELDRDAFARRVQITLR